MAQVHPSCGGCVSGGTCTSHSGLRQLTTKWSFDLLQDQTEVVRSHLVIGKAWVAERKGRQTAREHLHPAQAGPDPERHPVAQAETGRIRKT